MKDCVGCEIAHGSSKKTGNVRINGTSRCVPVPIVAVERRYVLHILSVCVCSVSYPSRKTHAPYYTLLCAPCACTTFSHVALEEARF